MMPKKQVSQKNLLCQSEVYMQHALKYYGIVKKSAVRKYPKSKIGRYQAA
jgi:hypothetical protein